MPDLSDTQKAQLVALVDAQARARERVRLNVIRQVSAIIARLAGHWYDERAVAAAGRQIEQVVRQGQVITGDATQAYIDHTLDLMGVRPSRDGVSLPDRLRNVPADIEWARPAKEYRRLRLRGLDEFDAQERALQRAERMAEMDLDLAMREAARQRMAPVEKITGYRRVIHPELSRTGTCGLCVAAADNVYRKAKLLPIHDGCNCETLPIVQGRGDPARGINDVDITELYKRVLAEAGSTAADELRKTRIQVTEHGELGPVLVDAGHRFRDQADAVADIRDTAEAAAVASA